MNYPITEIHRMDLREIMTRRKIPHLKALAAKIGLSYYQFYLPWSGRQGCSRLSMDKILNFIKRNKRETTDVPPTATE